MCSWTGRLLLLFLLLKAFPATALDYQSLQEGLDYALLQPDPGLLPKLHFLRVDLKKYQVKVLDARTMKSSVLPVKFMAEQTHALAAINANFFDENQKPLGLVVENGKLVNPPRPISWYAALLLKGDQAKIQKLSDSQVAKQFENAIQAGPRLVIGGKVPKLKEESSPKSAVGIDGQGRLIFIASEGDIEIGALARLLALSEKKGGAGILHALNLDGGSSTQFFIKAGTLDLWIPGFSKVPVGLGVFSRY